MRVPRPILLGSAASVFVLCALLFRFSLVPIPMQDLGMKRLEWQILPGCRIQDGELDATWQVFAEGLGTSQICRSKNFSTRGDRLDLYYAAKMEPDAKSEVKIVVTSESGSVLGRHIVPQAQASGNLRRMRVSLESLAEGERVRVGLVAKGASVELATVLHRVDFYQRSSVAQKIREITHSGFGAFALCSLFAASLIVFLSQCRTIFSSKGASFLCFLLLSLLFHFRPEVFFYADEWFLLERLFDSGIKGVLLTHNEHFIPLFTFVYYLEYQIFAGAYAGFVFVSCLLHTLNAVLLLELLKRISAERRESSCAWIVVLAYLLSGSQATGIQWVLCQSSLLAVSFGLGSGLFFWSYLERQRTRSLMVAMMLLVLATLSFGGALVLFAILPLLFIAYRLLRRERMKLSLALPATLAWILSLCVVSMVYGSFRDGFHHDETGQMFASTAVEIGNFILAGSQFGTILRGTGLYPFHNVQPSVCQYLPGSASPEDCKFFFYWLGAGVNVLLLVVYFFAGERKGRRGRIVFWLLGNAIIFCSFVLVAAGRAHLGDFYATSLRYQAFPQIAWAILVLPLFSWLARPLKLSARWRLRSFGALLILVVLLCSQFYQLMTFSNFAAEGLSTRRYLEDWREWQQASSAELQGARPYFFSESLQMAKPLEVEPEKVVQLLK